MTREHDPRSLILAIDPGVNGAWAVLGFQGEFIGAGELPRFDKSLNPQALSEIVWSYWPERVILERVGPMPKQGLSSTFTFGAAYGVCIGVVGGAGVPFALVTPSRWKNHFRLLTKPKDAARELAIKLYPAAAKSLTLKKHVGRADALLLARYALDMDTGRKFT